MAVWRAPRLWPGGTAYILGGGPGLALVEPERLRGRHLIAINNAAVDFAPWADVAYWADRRWLEWNLAGLARHSGAYKVTRAAPSEPPPFTVHRLRHDRLSALSRDPAAVAGYCGGGNGVNLAYLMGAARIVLFGFDMRPLGHWHGGHPVESKPTNYAERYIPALRRMAAELARDGVEVINATPGSALDCWPIVHPDEVLT